MSSIQFNPPGVGPTNQKDPLDGSAPKSQVPNSDEDGVSYDNKPFGGSGPVLPKPAMSMAAMSLILQAMNAKMSEESIKFGESTLDGVRDDVKKNNAKRAEELKKYFENMEKGASGKKLGLLSAIGTFFKKLFSGDVGGAFKTLGDNIGNILKDLGQIIGMVLAVVAAVALTAATGGAGAGVLAAVIVGVVLMAGSMVLSDPMIMEAMLETLPEDQRQALSIALAVICAVAALTGGILMGAATGVTGVLATISTITSVVNACVSGGVTIQQGVDGYQKSGYQVDAMLNQADIDKIDAFITSLKGDMSRGQSHMRQLMESYSRVLEDTRDMLRHYGQNLSLSSSV
ncbi:hypothetical protein LJC09_01135 [Desulfovibrio sp. OttesenSCG-928-F20]|nr:hypothetical protein [Desulfovibrio sp. OttesenSCG-928-F20]